jgi:transcriptional regulator with XRE-family HTH domain
MDQVAVGRRLAAARKRVGIKTRKDLADRVNLPRLGKETLGKIERGERPLYEHEAPYVARALEVPVSYFYEEETADTQLDRIEKALSDARAERDEHAEKIRGLLSRQSELLETIKDLVETLRGTDWARLPDRLAEQQDDLRDELRQDFHNLLAQTARPTEPPSRS